MSRVASDATLEGHSERSALIGRHPDGALGAL